jgi:hypothetical protein
MALSKVGYVYLYKFVISEISKGQDQRVVHGLAGLAFGVGVPIKDARSAVDVEEGGAVTAVLPRKRVAQ